MAEALTYDSLVSDVALYAERSDEPFITQIPRFIMLAENRLASELRGLGYLRFANFTMEIGQPVYSKPARWRETKDFSILINGERKFIYLRSNSWCRQYWSNTATVNVPEYYSDYDYEHFYIVGTPDQAYVAEISYHERPEPLSESNQTNWTTQYAPQLILYATLLEAQPFLKLPEKLQEWQAMFERSAQAFAHEQQLRVQ
jgi:hypothetical protein